MSETAPPSAPSALVTNLSLALLCLIWGSTWIVIRGGLADLPPYTSAAVRFTVAGAAMTVLAQRLAKSEGGKPPTKLLWSVLGTLNFALSYGIVYRTETILPSGLVALLWGIFPMLQALAARAFLPGVRFAPRQWLGFVLGLLGLAFLFLTDLRAFGPEGVPAALVLCLSPLVCVVGNTVVKRYGAGTSSLLLNRNALLLGALLLGLTALGERDAPARWTPSALASVAYLSLIGTVVTFGLYYWLLRFVDAHKLALISYVTPAIALSLGTLVGDEPFTATMAVGSALILFGIVLVVRPARAANDRGSGAG